MVTIAETSSWPWDTQARIELESSGDADYDLIVSCEHCGTDAMATSSEGPGELDYIDYVMVEWPTDQTRDLTIEVIHASGEGEWTLRVVDGPFLPFWTYSCP